MNDEQLNRLFAAARQAKPDTSPTSWDAHPKGDPNANAWLTNGEPQWTLGANATVECN